MSSPSAYSEEGQILTRWGVEGVTYKRSGDKFELLPGIKAGYMGINVDDENAKDLRVDFGMGNGVFIFSMYNGHNKELMYSYMTEEARNFVQIANEKCTLLPPDPPVLMDDLEREEANMIGQALSDYVKQMTLQFITGKADIEKDWDTFVQECKAKGADKLVQMTNEIYKNTKDILK